MNKIIFFSTILTLLLSGCTSSTSSNSVIAKVKPNLTLSQEKTWQLMQGKWYGDQSTDDNGKREWLVERYPDGTYKIDFRQTNKDGTKNDSTEVGQWGVSGNIYFSIFRGRVINKKMLPVNPSNPYNYDAYKILQLNDEIFKYEATSSNHRFTAKRKPSNFQLFP